MGEEKVFFGKVKRLLERIDSLDGKWYVEVWFVKYYLFGIEIHSQKKEIVKHTPSNVSNLNTIQ